jgi:hypothetical protein
MGNGAEGAGVVAPFGDLEITHVRGAAQELPHPGMPGDRIRNETPAGELGHEVVEIGEPEKQIDLRHLRLQLIFVALHQAPDGHDSFHVARLLEPGGFEQGVDGFLFGGVDEPTGVDEHHVGAGQVGRERRPVAHQVSHEPLGIDRRLVARAATPAVRGSSGQLDAEVLRARRCHFLHSSWGRLCGSLRLNRAGPS